MSFIVAIDGPAGSGKGTITKILANKLKLKIIKEIERLTSMNVQNIEVLAKGLNVNNIKNKYI